MGNPSVADIGASQIEVKQLSATLDLSHLTISGVPQRACLSQSCPALGVGLGSYGARVRAQHFTVEGTALCGLHLAAGGELDASHGT